LDREEFFKTKHPAYLKYQPIWTRIYRAYRGGDGFKNSFLWKYEREEQEEWLKRIERTAYENHTRDIVERFSSIIYSRKISREVAAGNGARWEELNEDFDLCGRAREDWVRKVAFPLSQAFGWLPVYVDSNKTKQKTETEADKKELGLRPFVMPILPFDFLNWEVDRFKQLEWALARMGKRSSNEPMVDAEDITEYLLLKRNTTEIWEESKGKDGGQEYRLVNEVPHNLGVVPIVILKDMELPDEGVVGYPSILDSTDLSILLYNYSSWSEEVAYKTLYNMMAAPEDAFSGEEEAEMPAGPSYIFRYPVEGNPPSWVSPPVAPIEVFRSEIKDIRRRIYELAGLDAGHAEERQSELSGVAYSIKRENTEDKAIRLGQSLQAFEQELDWLLMEKVEGQSGFKSEIIYPRRYAVRDTRDALEQQKIVEESTTIPPKVKARLAAKIINTTDFAELSDKDQQELEQAILDYNPQAEEVEQLKQMKRAEVEELVPLETEKIKVQKQHAETIAESNVQRERIRQMTELEKLKHEEKLKKMELEQKPAEAPVPKEKPSLWS